MDKASGVQLFKTWPDLDGQARLAIIEQVVRFEKQMASICFPVFGHLYHLDLKNENMSYIRLDPSINPSSMFCIGPSCDRSWQLPINSAGHDVGISGPCMTYLSIITLEYFSSSSYRANPGSVRSCNDCSRKTANQHRETTTKTRLSDRRTR